MRERTPDERRQNLDMMLEEYGMGEYDPFVLLQYTQGRCPQDGFFLKKISEKKISEEVRQRREKRMLTATASPDGKVLITQAGGGVIVVEKSLFCEYTANPDSMKLSLLGDSLFFSDGGAIDYLTLDEMGASVAIDGEVFRIFAEREVISTSEVMKILGCTRQNVDDLVKRGRLRALSIPSNTKLFYRRDVEGLES